MLDIQLHTCHLSALIHVPHNSIGVKNKTISP